MISVIVPVYNGEKYIDRCLNNILSQTYTDIEIVLIDDGSTDDTHKRCQKLSQFNKRILYIHNSINQGVSIARNIGIDNVNGEYICFVDVDDILLPNTLELLYQPSYDLICGNFELTQNNQIINNKYVLCLEKTLLNRKQFINKTYEYIQQPIGTNNLYSDVWAKLHKTSIIKQHNIRFHPYMTKDEVVAFSIEYATYVNTCLLIPDIVYKYTQIEEMAYYSKYQKKQGDLVFNMVVTFRKAKDFLRQTHTPDDKSNRLLLSFMNYYLNRYLYYNQLLGYI